MNKINVNLYGGKSIFGGKESPLEADEIYCDCADKCSFYAEGKCLRCRSFLAPTCKFGSNSINKGYTRRAAKYYDFKRKYQKDEYYNKLHYPSELAAMIDDYLYLNLKYTLVRKRTEKDDAWRNDVNGYLISEVGFCSGDVFFPLSDVTNELLHAIFSYKPCAMMGGVIQKYQSKVVPDVLMSLKKCAPKIYTNFILEYPQYDLKPDYVGKYAYIKTMVDGSVLTDCHGNNFTLKDGKLIGEKIKLGFTPFNGVMDCVVEVADSKTYEVNNNSQCDENTRFK
ncbi:MAG: hypothetical protein M0R51_17385 [Clostridia bacterium]|jgi:hypothetical protein|nr:hypothetical protein [Clostridia bacterium]